MHIHYYIINLKECQRKQFIKNKWFIYFRCYSNSLKFMFLAHKSARQKMKLCYKHISTIEQEKIKDMYIYIWNICICYEVLKSRYQKGKKSPKKP